MSQTNETRSCAVYTMSHKGEDESLLNAVEICIDEDYLNKWIEESDDAISGYFINSFEYDEEDGEGTVEVVLE